MSEYSVEWYTETGSLREVSAESLERLADALVEAGYDGPHVRVTDDAGWTVGWVGVDLGAVDGVDYDDTATEVEPVAYKRVPHWRYA